MAILLTGDFHGNALGELQIITQDSLFHKYGQDLYGSINYHIILGDGGFFWPNNIEDDKYNFQILSKRNFPILCVLGNHEPIYGKKRKKEVDIGIGAKVYKINDNPFIAYLKRGKVYTIDGIKFLVLGGALSIDKYRRIPDVTWWKNEYWSEQEKNDLFKLLETDNSFDCVISHTGPRSINKELFKYHDTYYDKSFDEVPILNEEILNRIHFQQWWCGHWHEDEYLIDLDKKRKFQYLYRTTKILEKKNNKLIVHNEHGLKSPII